VTQRWQEWVSLPQDARAMITAGFEPPAHLQRRQGVPSEAVSDPAVCAEHVLTGDNADLAVLVYDEAVRSVVLAPNPYLAGELAHAVNEWVSERWLGADDRFRGSILVSPQLPERAAAEIRRLVPSGRFCQVLLVANPLDKAFGHMLYDPVYEAAEECGLPIYIGTQSTGAGSSSPVGGGYPNFAFEAYALCAQPLMTHLLSFFTHGVFDRFPGLRVVLGEAGQAWLAPFIWRADDDFKSLRREVPWVKELPSEYLVEHVRVTTSPLDQTPSRQAWRSGLESIGGPGLLLYASGFPRWDMTSLTAARALLGDDWTQPVLEHSALALEATPV
jgi:predicted TIM-barrel fold metal-dependent hydrolase